MRRDTMETILDSYYLDEPIWKRGRNLIALIALAAWGACALGYVFDRHRFEMSYLVAFVFVLTIGLGTMFFVIVQHLGGAAWSVSLRRIAENIMITVPVGAILFVPVALSLHGLYEWTHLDVVAADSVLQGKQPFLNETAFLVRAVLYFLVWTLLSVMLYRHSVAQDDSGDAARQKAAARWSAAGIILLTVTVTMAAFDWIMSLEPHWFSTIFGVYVYSGAGVAAVAGLTLVLLAFRRANILRYSVNHEHYHDLGKWLFALTIFWAYIGFSQYLLIWYANLPEETFWFRGRISGAWGWVAALIVTGNFLAPFLALISRAAKRNLGMLGAACGWMLLMHYVDIYWLVMPVFFHEGPSPHWLDAAAVFAVGSVFALAFWSKLKRAALAPVGDPRFERALEFRNS